MGRQSTFSSFFKSFSLGEIAVLYPPTDFSMEMFFALAHAVELGGAWRYISICIFACVAVH